MYCILISILIGLGIGYNLGYTKGKKRGEKIGFSQAPLIFLEKSLEQGYCLVCNNKTNLSDHHI